MRYSKAIAYLVYLAVLIFPGLLQAEEKPEIFAQMGHTNQVTSIAVSPDGRFAVSGSNDSTIKLWDVASGREIRTFAGHKPFVTAVAFSPDGRYVLSGGEDSTMKLWDMATGREIRTFRGHIAAVRSVAVSPDGRYALSESYDAVKLWEVSTGREIGTFPGNTGGTRSAGFSWDGRSVLSGGAHKTMRLWEVSTGRVLRVFPRVNAAALSPDGKYALSADDDRTVTLWDVATGREIRTFAGHKYPVSAVAFSPDGKQALSGGIGAMKLWEVSTGRELREFPGNAASVAFSPEGKYALSASGNKIQLWDLASGKEVRAFQGNAPEITAIAMSPDSRYILSAGSIFKKAVDLWDLAGARQARAFEGQPPVALSRDGRHALYGSWNGALHLWDRTAGGEARTFSGQKGRVRAAAFSPDGKYVLSGSDQAMKLWDVATRSEIRTFPSGAVLSVAMSPDGRYALSGNTDKTLKLWDVGSGKEIRAFQGQTDSVNAIAMSPDGKYALTSKSWEKTMKLREVATGREARTFPGHETGVNSVAFSPDGRSALSGGWDGTMKLWDISTGREKRTFRGDGSPVFSVAMSADGRYAVSGSRSGATTVWGVASGREIASLIGFTGGEWVVITPEGYFNASANGAKYLNVRIGNSVYGVDQFYARFYRPELVQLALAGKALPKGESLGEVAAKKNAPTVRIVSPQPGATVDTDSVTVSLRITENGGGVGNVTIHLNGSQVANDTRAVVMKGKESAAERSLSFTVPLMAGTNEIRAMAMNREGSMESSPAVITVTSKVVLAKPNLYALVVGINEYQNKSISLSYAVPDALAFSATLEKVTGPLFGKTEIKTLTKAEETTKGAITKAFADLRPKVKPNDLFVFYDASHGVVDVVDNEEQYYLLTSNVLLLSSRHIGTTAISQKELSGLIGSIPAQKKLVILDTCNAGKGGKELQIALLQQTRGLTESTAVKLLQRSIGSAVFSASSDSQQALEGYKGHGLFTYVLLEGLQGKADIKKDGFITVLGLADYVEEQVMKLSEEHFKRQQTPTIQTGANFPIAKVK